MENTRNDFAAPRGYTEKAVYFLGIAVSLMHIYFNIVQVSGKTLCIIPVFPCSASWSILSS
ncbi:MAG: hypothetical protein ABR512_12855 [Desulfopila sp.]